MKYILAFIFLPVLLHAQTADERKKIADSYDKVYIQKLQDEAVAFYKRQAELIKEYKLAHPFMESADKTLMRIEDNGVPIFYTTDNQGSSLTIGTNKMYPGGVLGLSVTGAGMTAGVWDGGKVLNTHVEFGGNKVTLANDTATILNVHSTHVTGTIIASGVSALRRGIAYGGMAKTYDWTDDYNEMLAFGAAGFVASNHSYGYIAANLTSNIFGSYDASSIEIDNVSNACPYYQVVVAAGNDRDDTTIAQVVNKGGFDLLTGKCNAKNGIVVAAVEQVTTYIDPSSVVMSSFSNFGPTDDGRIKPDISAKGVAVNSCTSSSDTAYAILQGTSMATPAITGMILMLQKHYNNLNPSTFMRASTVRGLICHSAKEAGDSPGPDYQFGWGLADAASAARIISNRNVSSILEENTLNNGATFTKQIGVDVAQNIAATICWTDPTGSSNGSQEDNRVPRLKNNLDLKILKDGVIYYPWKLDVESSSDPATNTSDNDVDNVEKVEIPNAEPGIYTIQVTHKGSLTGGSQVFSLIANGATGLNLATRDYISDNSIYVYPNPATTVLNYNIKNNVTLSSVVINDVTGKEVYANTGATIPTQIDITHLAAGVYFVTFKAESTLVTKKFIKE